MARALLALVAAVVLCLSYAGAAEARGGDYRFDGGTRAQQAQVRAALEASAFPWSLVPARITIHIAPTPVSHARPGHIYLDSDLLSAGRFAWATVQDEYAHQVDFFLLDGAKRAQLTSRLGARDWCYGVPGFLHSEYGCERFASTLVWSYWPSKHNAYRPGSTTDEAAAMSAPAFRALLADLIAAPRTAEGARL